MTWDRVSGHARERIEREEQRTFALSRGERGSIAVVLAFGIALTFDVGITSAPFHDASLLLHGRLFGLVLLMLAVPQALGFVRAWLGYGDPPHGPRVVLLYANALALAYIAGVYISIGSLVGVTFTVIAIDASVGAARYVARYNADELRRELASIRDEGSDAVA